MIANSNAQNISLTVGRVLLASLFILGGLNKVLNFDATLMKMSQAGFNPALVFLVLTILLELGGGLILAYGKKGAAYAAAALAVFTIFVNLVFHRFWDAQVNLRELELSLFFKNISIFGGLVFVAASAWKKR